MEAHDREQEREHRFHGSRKLDLGLRSNVGGENVMNIDFARGLSDGFMLWLESGPGRALMDLFGAEGLDTRLRADYFNVYEAQCSLARVRWMQGDRVARVSVHRAYLLDTPLLRETGSDYVTFVADDSTVAEYARHFQTIRRTAEKSHHGAEGTLEAQCLRDNLTGTPLLAFDRQIALPGERGRRLDILAVAADPSRPLLVAVELKRGLNSDIQYVARQTLTYMEMLDPDRTGLRADIGRAYQRVCTQLRALGRSAPNPTLIRPGMPVAGLAAFADYKAKSKLLGRAEVDAQTLARRIQFCHLDLSRLVLPDPATWPS